VSGGDQPTVRTACSARQLQRNAGNACKAQLRQVAKQCGRAARCQAHRHARCTGAACECQHPAAPRARTAASAARSALLCFSSAAVRADLGVEGGVSSSSSSMSWSSAAAGTALLALLSTAGAGVSPAARAAAAVAASPAGEAGGRSASSGRNGAEKGAQRRPAFKPSPVAPAQHCSCSRRRPRFSTALAALCREAGLETGLDIRAAV